MSPTCPRPHGAAAIRQADPRFIRAEIELKRKFTQLFDVEEYVGPPPTESTVAQTQTRRRRLQSKIDGALAQQTTPDPLAAAAAKRQANPRFKRAEYDIKEECERVLGANDYEGPSTMETSDRTSWRRGKMRRKISQARNPKEKKMGASQFNLSSFDDAESLNVTDILLGACGIKDVQRQIAASCSYFKKRICSKNASHGVLLYTMGESDNNDADNKKKMNHCNFGCVPIGYCCEIGDNGMHFSSGHRRVFAQELGHWITMSHWVGPNLLKQINIDGETLRGLVDASTGGRKGLQMRREVSIFKSCWHSDSGEKPRAIIDPDPMDIKRGRWYSADIEDILYISDGIITFDDRPDKTKFKVTGAGGKPSYATGSIFGAYYNGYVEDNFHSFGVTLEQASGQCKMNNLLSAEIHINGEIVTTLGESDNTDSAVLCKDGKMYKRVVHNWGLSYWYDMLTVDVVYGPLKTNPDEIFDEDTESELEDDQDPYNLLMRQPKNVKIDFVELSVVDNVLKKGGTLHHIALRDSSSDKRTSMT